MEKYGKDWGSGVWSEEGTSGGGCAPERGTAGAHSPVQVKGMRTGGTPTPLDFPVWAAGVADFGDLRWEGWGKPQERSTPAAQEVAVVVTSADAPPAGLEEFPGFTPRAWLLQ